MYTTMRKLHDMIAEAGMEVPEAGILCVPNSTPWPGQTVVMAAAATRKALADAGIGYERIQQAYIGYVYGDSTAGIAMLKDIDGKPFSVPTKSGTAPNEPEAPT